MVGGLTLLLSTKKKTFNFVEFKQSVGIPLKYSCNLILECLFPLKSNSFGVQNGFELQFYLSLYFQLIFLDEQKSLFSADVSQLIEIVVASTLVKSQQI